MTEEVRIADSMINRWREEDYYREMERDHQRSIERRNQTPPMQWGTRMDEEHYFCLPCWQRGFEDGSHPYSDPPCDSEMPWNR